MSKGLPLTKYEKGRITELIKSKKTAVEISNIIERSRQVINSYILNTLSYKIKQSKGRPKKLSLRTRASIIRKSKGKKLHVIKLRQN